MTQLPYGRTLMGDSLGFHILFALFGVGIPLLICLAEFIGIYKKNNTYYAMARRWTFVLGALFVVGAISGLIISNQLSMVWPGFMTLAGKVIGLPFYMEAFAFFIEAIFLGIYVYSWDRFANKYIHWLCSLPIVLGSLASAFFITTANAWMNSPQGFTYTNGVASNINPIKAMFNPATYTETTHSIVSYYFATALIFAGIYAWSLMFGKNRDNEKLQKYRKTALTFTMIVSLVFSILILFTGDQSAKYIANHEPLKLAAAEGLYTTQSNAPLQIAGIVGKSSLNYAFEIPGMLSFLAFGNTHAIVKGLNAFDPNLWPPLWVHYMFDLMVGSGMFIILAVGLYFVFYIFWRDLAYLKLVLWLIILSGPAAIFAIEFGWILTEVGRQPYVIAGIMTTAQAFTTSDWVVQFAAIFPILYTILLILTPWVLVRHYRRTPLDLDIDYFNAPTQ